LLAQRLNQGEALLHSSFEEWSSTGERMPTGTTHLRTITNEDGAAILDTKQGSVTTLNATGAFIWQELERGRCEEEIVESLVHETDVPPEVIQRDVRDFLALLQDHGMLLR
jgi:hypothetical protein